MVFLIIIYIVLFILHQNKISKIKNPAKTIGEVSGSEIIVINKINKRTKDIVSFYVDNELFVSDNYSSPVIYTSKHNDGEKYEVVYDAYNPNSNVIINNDIFSFLRKVIFVIITVYIEVIVCSLFMV